MYYEVPRGGKAKGGKVEERQKRDFLGWKDPPPGEATGF